MGEQHKTEVPESCVYFVFLYNDWYAAAELGGGLIARRKRVAEHARDGARGPS